MFEDFDRAAFEASLNHNHGKTYERRRSSIFPVRHSSVNLNILESTVEISVEKKAPIPPPRRKLRVLALHGFGQSADFFRMKTKRLTQYLETQIQSDLLDQYPEGIEWLFPDGPVRLATETTFGVPSDDIDMRAWWTRLEFHVQLEQLYNSLEYLCKYLKESGPVDGVLGFSQGASIAAMLTALCEGSIRPERVEALANQGLPLFIPPPQAPFKFAVLCSGFKNAPQFYAGFFSPKISTPTMHVIAEWDHMVSAEQSAALIDDCEDAVVIRHYGTHATPTDKNSMYEMSRFMGNAVTRENTTAIDGDETCPIYALPMPGLDDIVETEVTKHTVTVTTITEMALPSGTTTPNLSDGSSIGSSPTSDSPPSSVLEFGGRKKMRRLRFARKITVRRI
ncbi:Dihydrofolate reductase [Pseudocercospora fuligena]|uniref:Dihydrofolate reductase n=1 Tax=Pseudocercospora fuligena TaxID=685502 RepID=A0A8H6RFZ5_9PEZI|nr:Dihydrofolate reductase [Pseudocercospora fuligena]